ncbi:TIGR02221 family CRISPR-associated protein [Planctomicrobium sp. SH664]|uniref:TIGR02221 family CRISPR-associated protein n=1 Tax=Planctomicrobium sp. SH664 TaxID=3448125 RepID=UPI003F5C1711
MKLLTFLGTNNYLPTTYTWAEKGKRKNTRLFPLALADWLEPEEIFVFLTSDAEKHDNWRELQESINATPVHIVDGASEEDLWKIFDKIVKSVKPHDQLAIDITHGFRSLPLLGLLVAAYLKSSKDVTVEHLVYGAYEARDKEKNESPVFELTSFLALFDWMIASDHFLKTGYGRPLAGLLVDADGAIGELRNGILQLSDGLHLLRPPVVTQSASELESKVHQAAQEASHEIPPLAEMLNHISESYGRFSIDDTSPKQQLEAQLKMVDWYLERRQFVQAYALAREWLPSFLCVYFDVDMMDHDERSDMEFLLQRGGKSVNKVSGEIERESPRRVLWQAMDFRKRLARIWNEPFNLANLRNDVLHAGFRKNPKTPEEIEKAIREIAVELKAIWSDFKEKIA